MLEVTVEEMVGVSAGAGVGGWESTGAGDGGARVWAAAGSGPEVATGGAATGSAGVCSAVNMVLLVVVSPSCKDQLFRKHAGKREPQ